MKRIVVHRVGALSAAEFGCVLGTLLNLLPGLAIALGSRFTLSSLRTLLEGWQSVQLGGVLGQGLPVNVITLLHLEGALKTLQVLDGHIRQRPSYT